MGDAPILAIIGHFQRSLQQLDGGLRAVVHGGIEYGNGDYWQQASCDRMPPKIAIAVFDAAVHHGPKTAIKLLQRALKVADDGEYGRITHGTLQSRDTNETLELMLAQRAIYLTTCPAWPTYKLGWLKRLFNLARSNFA